MNNFKQYSSERNVQILVSILKEYNIHRVIVSPGTTNIEFVACLQYDNYFNLFSAPDERSAAYMACGMSLESGEPVVLSCTGATASRNYMPGLTEAYYQKLPIIAVTSSQLTYRIGNLHPQAIDRSKSPKDVCVCKIQIDPIENDNDENYCVQLLNRALLTIGSKYQGPIHINLAANISCKFDIESLPNVNKINRHYKCDKLPEIPDGIIGIFIGSHNRFEKEDTDLIEEFCKKNNAVVFSDHTSNYFGLHKFEYSLIGSQDTHPEEMRLDLLIHIGEVSGEYSSLYKIKPSQVWRVSEDGCLRDTFGTLKNVFQMKEKEFFSYYSNISNKTQHPEYLSNLIEKDNHLRSLIKELPFSNIWSAYQLHNDLPKGSSVHLGILNSLRSWNFFPIGNHESYSNVGGFGIDGGISSLIGASLSNPEKIFFGFFGDLAFFYDINVLGNRHIGKNLRIMLINNGLGTEFRQYNHPANAFGDGANAFMAAEGHYGHKSSKLVKHIAENLGFKYLCAIDKSEFNRVKGDFLSPDITTSIVFEIFTSQEDESDALRIMRNLEPKTFRDRLIGGGRIIKRMVKRIIKSVIR